MPAATALPFGGTSVVVQDSNTGYDSSLPSHYDLLELRAAYAKVLYNGTQEAVESLVIEHVVRGLDQLPPTMPAFENTTHQVNTIGLNFFLPCSSEELPRQLVQTRAYLSADRTRGSSSTGLGAASGSVSSDPPAGRWNNSVYVVIPAPDGCTFAEGLDEAWQFSLAYIAFMDCVPDCETAATGERFLGALPELAPGVYAWDGTPLASSANQDGNGTVADAPLPTPEPGPTPAPEDGPAPAPPPPSPDTGAGQQGAPGLGAVALLAASLGAVVIRRRR